jgi:uncharacterized membrane protein YecN with MAPEG domain
MISILFLAFFVIIFIYCSFNIIKIRKNSKLPLSGTNDPIELTRWIAAQNNFNQYSIWFLLMLFVIDFYGDLIWEVLALGVVFAIGRIFHLLSMTKLEKYENGQILEMPKYRIWGMKITLLILFYMIVRISYIAITLF